MVLVVADNDILLLYSQPPEWIDLHKDNSKLRLRSKNEALFRLTKQE